MQSLVTAAWLMEHLSEVRVCDVRWYLTDPGQGRQEYADAHICGAVYVDVEADLTAADGPGRHPLPAREVFASTLGSAGIANSDLVVAYDNSGGAIAARLWWMMRWLGHDKVAVLDGGIAAWLAAGGSLTSDGTPIQETNFGLGPPLEHHVDRQSVADRNRTITLIDARAEDRYQGVTEPIDAAAGHIPGAINIPFVSNLDENGLFLSPSALRAKYKNAPTIAYCGSGVTACHTILAFHVAGYETPKLYGGSWSDWAQAGGPVATGA